MIPWIGAERLKREAAEPGGYSIRVAVVLSLIFSLAVVAILSRQQPTNHFWVAATVFAAPIPVALYFRNGIARLGAYAFAAVMIFFLGAAVLYGI
jgi:energy-converting hydrogenase Eha subunit A